MDWHGIRTADRSCRAEQPRCLRILIAVSVFELLNVKVEKLEKTT